MSSARVRLAVLPALATSLAGCAALDATPSAGPPACDQALGERTVSFLDALLLDDSNGAWISYGLDMSGRPVACTGPGFSPEARNRYLVEDHGEFEPNAHVTWSNGHTENVGLPMRPEGGQDYVLLAYELKPGMARNDARIERPNRADLRQYFWAELGVTVLAPVVVPGAVLYALATRDRDEPADSRPFPGCCFVWIENARDGIVVAGERP